MKLDGNCITFNVKKRKRNLNEKALKSGKKTKATKHDENFIQVPEQCI